MWTSHPAKAVPWPPGTLEPSSSGFWKRNLYLHGGQLPSELTGSAVDKTVIVDPALWQALSGLHDALVAREEVLNAEGRLAMIRERIRRHLSPRQVLEAPEAGVAQELRLLLDEHATETTETTRRRHRRGPKRAPPRTEFHGDLRRQSSRLPHRPTDRRRTALLLAGVPPAQVATTTGFYDRAHLTRHFKRHVSTTPARYARSHPYSTPEPSAPPPQNRQSGAPLPRAGTPQAAGRSRATMFAGTSLDRPSTARRACARTPVGLASRHGT